MTGDEPADLEQGHVAAVRVADDTVPLVFAPAMEQIYGSTPDPCEVLDRLRERTVQVLVVAWVDRRANVGGRESLEMSATQERIDPRARLEQVADEPAEGREGRAVAVPELRLVETEDEVADSFGGRAHEQHRVSRAQLLVQFHGLNDKE